MIFQEFLMDFEKRIHSKDLFGANLNCSGARNVQVVASLYYISPPTPPTHQTTHSLPQGEDDRDYLLIDKGSRLVNNSDSTMTIHQTTSLLFHQVGQF